MTPEITVNGQPITMRITAVYQYRENYGAHNWEGEHEGPCPQYWKNKGGHEVILADGITREMMNDADFRNKLIQEAMKHEQFNHWSEYQFINLQEDLTGSWTYREIVDAYCDLYIDLEQEPEDDDQPFTDYFMDTAEELGYEA